LGRDCPWQSVGYFSLFVIGLICAGQAQYLLSMVLCWEVPFVKEKCRLSASAAMMILGHTWC
jgi:hypothetical protein